MKRSEVLPAGVSRAAIARIASLGVAVASLSSAACAPDQSVKPGAPELIAYYVVQAGPTPTKIVPDTPDCPAAVATGAACMPAPADPMVPPDALCRDVTASHWCNCIGTDMDDPTVGAWNCDPFAGVISVIAIFDRLLDTEPLDPGAEPALTDVMPVTVASAPIPVLTDYGSNGTPTGLLLPFFAEVFLGNFRTGGPSLFTVPDPTFPSNAAVTVELNHAKVLAKDGTTTFSGTGALLDGVIHFKTAAFSVTIVPPDLSMESMDKNTVIVAFTNLTIDVEAVTMRAHATVNGAVAEISVAQVNEATMSITPAVPWPAGATVEITLDPGVTSVAGDTLAAPATRTFTIPTP
jgi:hypothetical protein